jgi:hypothetical protein
MPSSVPDPVERTAPTTFYHRTTDASATAILSSGFVDGEGSYMLVGLEKPLRGVWLSNTVPESHEGASGDAVLSVELDLPADVLRFYEVVEQGRVFREWLMPAELVNRGRVRRLSDEEIDAAPTHFDMATRE